MNNQLSDIEKKYQKQQSVSGRFMTRFRLGLKQGIWKTVVASSYVLKRAMDILASLMAIIMLSPVFLFTGLAIKLEDPGPSIFKQERVGRWGKTFTMFKFRSMVMDAEKLKEQLIDQNESEAGVIFKMKKDPRITRVGSFIRKYSIDELPQLFNVLNGDMSLVGPRPPVPAEVQEYSLSDRRRLDVTPGITCIWQVSGRSDIDFEGQVRLDVQYINSQSFLTDVMILLKTVPAVLLGKGAY
ncbi:MAG: exopolysaccharide biosynthesis polyprenyl glycosylphosphotransferase [Gammaproteobacteria bacterium]